MKKPRYDKVDLYLADWDLNTRQSCKTVLYNHGFRGIGLGKTLKQVEEAVSKQNIDLLMCSAHLEDGDYLDFIKRLRRNEVGSNPFLPIITLVDEASPELITKVMACGTDTVIAKPISTGQLLDRIDGLISARKPFVVTEEYIGPARRGEKENTVEVPNPLKAKVTGKKLSFLEIENAIKSALGKLDEQRLQNLGVKIASHVTNLVPMLQRGPVDDDVQGELLALVKASENAQGKVRETKFAHVSDLCQSIMQVSNAIHDAESGVPESRDVMLLKPLSQAIQACFSGVINSPEEVQAIVKQISGR